MRLLNGIDLGQYETIINGVGRIYGIMNNYRGFFEVWKLLPTGAILLYTTKTRSAAVEITSNLVLYWLRVGDDEMEMRYRNSDFRDY